MEKMKLGTPKHEQNKKNYFSFGKDRNMFILRILPPMGQLADKGKWSIFHRVEFGYTGTDGRMKPFLSPRVVNFDKMVEVESGTYLRREKIKAQYEAAKAAGNKPLEEQTNNLLRKYNQDAKHYMNAIDLNGNVGLFKIGHRGFQALQVAIKKLNASGCEPVGINNGRFFVFSREGKNRDTIYTVEEYKQKKETENGIGDFPMPHDITDVILNKLSTDAFELLEVYPSVTIEEENLILSGPEGVDQVFNAKKAAKLSAKPVETAPVETAPVADTPIDPVPVTETAPVAETPAPLENPTPDVSNQSEEEFFKMMADLE